ncbi:MAG TPA: ankyrin repeat domain-containing protein [Vicinamibacterales bacterium]|nr:ankyrin repeat domain-containing protein [Vicinamibacterales bacterium]
MRRLSIAALVAVGLACAPVIAADVDRRLIDAVRAQDAVQVRSLLGGKIDVNVRADDGSTPLLWAVHGGDMPVATALVRAGADANAANQFGMTPLSRACTNGSAEMVALLLKAGANPNTAIATGETPLMTCAASGAITAVKMLLARGAAVNTAEPSQHQTALMWAAAERHPDVAAALIEAGADLRARTKKGFTALHFAARDGDIPTVARLVSAGADVNAQSVPDNPESGRGVAYQSTLSAGSTPLLVAAVRGHVPLALYLLDHGADPNAGDAGFTALHWASGTWEGGVSNPVYGFSDPMSGIPSRPARLQLIRALLAHGANPNGRMTKRPFIGGGYEDAAGATAFILASAAADVEIMRMLLAAGADPTLVTDSKATAVMAASGLNRSVGESALAEPQVLAAVTLLFELGADARGETDFGENALFGAAYRGWNTLLELLIQKGANVNAVSKAGITPWLAASGYGDRLGGVLYNTEGAKILLAHGADPALGKPCQAQVKCTAPK